METEKKRFYSAVLIPLVLLILMWIIQFISYAFDIKFFEYGVHPFHWDGLPGILLMPFVHSGFKHLMANSVPFLILVLFLPGAFHQGAHRHLAAFGHLGLVRWTRRLVAYWCQRRDLRTFFFFVFQRSDQEKYPTGCAGTGGGFFIRFDDLGSVP